MSFRIEYLERLESDLRAASARRPRRRRALLIAPRALLASALVLLMGGSLALAFGGRVLTALGDGPAPGHVKQEFQQMVTPPYPLDGAPPLPKGYLPGKIVPGSQRRVLAVRTSRGTIATLYVARTNRGGYCVVTKGWPFGSGGCGSDKTLQGPFASLMVGLVARNPLNPARNSYARTLVGRVPNPRATTVRITYRGGGHDDIALVQGWFMFEVPKAHSKAAVAPIRLDALSASGARLGTLADPFFLHRAPPHFNRPVQSSIALLASAQLPNDGGTVRIWSGRDAQGDNCFKHLRNGRSQQFPAWTCSPMVGRWGTPLPPVSEQDAQKHVAVQWQMGLANDPRRPTGFGYAYAMGWVGPQVARLTVRFQDGTAADIPLHGRYYLYVVPPANWPAGHRPGLLEARNAAGAIVYHAFLYPRQHCIYPGHDPACANLGMGTG